MSRFQVAHLETSLLPACMRQPALLELLHRSALPAKDVPRKLSQDFASSNRGPARRDARANKAGVSVAKQV